MNITNENINIILNKYLPLVDDISIKFNYSDNLKHLLYLIIPSFVIKYGLENEKHIIDCFTNIPIIMNNKDEGQIKAFYSCKLEYIESSYITIKSIQINDYNNTRLIHLVDSLIHEFNHAINSYNNNIIIEAKNILVRTGLAYIRYNKNNIRESIKKADEFILEEVINTRQTELIMDIINSFNKYEINNIEIKNAVYALKSSTDSKYKSNAYFFQMYVCKELVNNRTFFSTLEKLRIKGNIEEIENWFDNIVGIDGTYLKLISLLKEIFDLTIVYSNKKFFKNGIKNKINVKTNDAIGLMNKFNNNCFFK